MNKHIEKSEDNIEAAEILLDKKKYSNSVSSSYYAMFHAARSLLSKRDITTKTHTGLLQKFSEEFVKNGKIDAKFSKILSNVEREREKADYDPEKDFTKDEAKKVLEQAREFVEECKKHL